MMVMVHSIRYDRLVCEVMNNMSLGIYLIVITEEITVKESDGYKYVFIFIKGLLYLKICMCCFSIFSLLGYCFTTYNNICTGRSSITGAAYSVQPRVSCTSFIRPPAQVSTKSGAFPDHRVTGLWTSTHQRGDRIVRG